MFTAVLRYGYTGFILVRAVYNVKGSNPDKKEMSLYFQQKRDG